MMVIMALVTTGMTTPILNVIYPRRLFEPRAQPVAEGVKERAAYSVLIPVSLPKSGAPLVQLADTLIGPDKEHSKLFAIHLRNPAEHEAYRSGLDEAAQSHDESLAPLLAQARGRSISGGTDLTGIARRRWGYFSRCKVESSRSGVDGLS